MKSDTITAVKLRVVKMISGVGCGISAMMGANDVKARASILHTPMLVDEKTIGNRSMCPMYRLPNVADVPKFMMNRQMGTTNSSKFSLAPSENITGKLPKKETANSTVRALLADK